MRGEQSSLWILDFKFKEILRKFLKFYFEITINRTSFGQPTADRNEALLTAIGRSGDSRWTLSEVRIRIPDTNGRKINTLSLAENRLGSITLLS